MAEVYEMWLQIEQLVQALHIWNRSCYTYGIASLYCHTEGLKQETGWPSFSCGVRRLPKQTKSKKPTTHKPTYKHNKTPNFTSIMRDINTVETITNYSTSPSNSDNDDDDDNKSIKICHAPLLPLPAPKHPQISASANLTPPTYQ